MAYSNQLQLPNKFKLVVVSLEVSSNADPCCDCNPTHVPDPDRDLGHQCYLHSGPWLCCTSARLSDPQMFMLLITTPIVALATHRPLIFQFLLAQDIKSNLS